MPKWSIWTRGWLAIVSLCMAAASSASREDIVEITEDVDKLRSTLETMPYAAQGEGRVIYTFEFSECPFSQRFYRDWTGRLDGLEMRRFFYAVSQRSANEMVELASSRDAADYQAYMERRRTAPQFDNRQQAADKINRNINTYNAVMKPLINVVTPILVSNGVIEGNLVSPMLIWEEGDRLFAAGGYDRAHIESVLTRARSDEPVADASVVDTVSNNDAEQDERATTETDSAFDILGLRLNMTPAAVAREMMTLNATRRDEKRYRFQGTEIEFLASQQWLLAQGGVISVEYARPPAEPVVIGLIRNFGFSAEPLPDERLRAAVREKYGEPDWQHQAAAGGVIAWSESANLEHCASVAPRNPAGASCHGPVLRMGIQSRESASGRVSWPRDVQLHDYAVMFENWQQFKAHELEVARRVEQARMKDNQAPSF